MWSPRSRQSKCLKAGDEAFRVGDEDVDFTIFNYWRWAHSDLLDNTARGVLAEFLVARALDSTCEPRHEWDAVDVRTECGLNVEVKSAAYAQSWPQCKPSQISFNIAPKKEAWNAKTNEYTLFDKPKRDADVYVFCLLLGQSECPGPKHDPDPDPMDLNQWEFYFLATESLNQEYPCQDSIGLNRLKSLVQCATPYGKLAQVIETVGNHT